MRTRIALSLRLATLCATLCAALATALLAALPASAQTPAAATAAGYAQPPANILAVMRAPVPPVAMPSPTHDAVLLVSWQEFPPLARVAAPFLKLAGARVEPRNRARHDTPGGYGIAPCAVGLELVRVADGRKTPVALPAGACADTPVWSADGKRFAFANVAADTVELWVVDAAGGVARRVPGARLNPMLGSELHWAADQKSLIVKLVPDGIGAAPPEPAVPSGPSIQESAAGGGESSTYEARDTLNNPHDEALFDHYAAAQIAVVDAATLTIARVGAPGRYEAVDVAPDGRWWLVTAIQRPYSYVTTHDRFPRTVAVWDVTDRARPTMRTIATLPLADRVPVQGVPTGARSFGWRATEPNTLIYAEALDGGDWNTNVPARDKVLMQKAPFTAAPVEIARTAQRYAGFIWGERPGTALLSEFDQNRRWFKTFLVDVDSVERAPRLVWDRSADEKYANPGRPVMRQLANGEWAMRQDGDAILLSGVGASPAGDRPFLDRFDLATRTPQRLFRSDRDAYERVIDVATADGRSFLTSRQSPTEPPNVYARRVGAEQAAAPGEPAYASTAVAVTRIPDPAPEVRAIKKRLVNYKRADGLDLSFTLYTPPGYVEGTRVPTILYAYPLDYADASKAGQVSGSQATFTRLRQYRLLLLAGYAIIDNASFPIVGDPKRAYDNYLEQLVADAKAAVDEAVRLGVADPERIGVTGHSHGALMTVNLLAHSDLFRAGVATSGSYNKTLTPFGFQSERRSVWAAPDVYVKASPFFVADKLKTPLLIVHGADDANPGTTPLQATKLYEAVRGNGGTTRLVMLPHEPHWYAARESNEQLVYEMVRWFDTYVKNAKPRAAAAG